MRKCSNIESARVDLKVKLKSTSDTPFQNFISWGNYCVMEETFKLILTGKVSRRESCDLSEKRKTEIYSRGQKF